MDIGFIENTFVRTINGYKQIKDIEIGDEVLTSRGRFKKVYRVERSVSDVVFTVVFDAENEVFPVSCGGNTEFFTFWNGDSLIKVKDMGAYCPAFGVNEYGELRGYEMALRIKEAPLTLYNLGVEDDESYTVTEYCLGVES